MRRRAGPCAPIPNTPSRRNECHASPFDEALLKHATLPALALLTGCAVGPNFHQPAAPAGAFYTPTRLTGTHQAAGPLGAAQTFVPAQDIPGQWWSLFHSPDLNQLIKQALQANPSIAAAQAALKVAQEDLLAQDGSFFPQIGASIGASKNLTSTASLAPVGAFNKAFYSLYTAQLSISYSPDVFGLNRRTVESLAAQAENKRDELEAADLSLSANVVTAAFQEAGLRAAIAAQQQTIKADQDLETIIARQYADGEVAQSVLLQQQTALAQAQQLLPPLQRQLDMQENALIALSGGYPNEMLPETFDLSQLASAADAAGQPALAAGGAAAGHSGQRPRTCMRRVPRSAWRSPTACRNSRNGAARYFPDPSPTLHALTASSINVARRATGRCSTADADRGSEPPPWPSSTRPPRCTSRR